MHERSHRRTLAILAFSVGTLILATSQAQDPGSSGAWQAPASAAAKPNPVPADAKSVGEGKTLYQQQCLACHGFAGKGNGPAAKDLPTKPGDLSDPKMWEQSDGSLFWKITTGRKPMPTYAMKLTDQQRWSIVNYVRTLAPKPAGK